MKWQANAKFKPTREMNADDVVFSFKRMFDRSNPFFKSANGNFPEFAELIEPSLESVERTDDETVVFTLKAPLAPLVSMLSMQAFSIISAEYAGTLEKSGKLESLDRDLIGTGPFSFVQYQKDTSVRFRAFPDFWGTLGNRPDRTAKVENLVFAITPDPACTLRQAARQRVSDRALSQPRRPPVDAGRPGSQGAGNGDRGGQLCLFQQQPSAIQRQARAARLGDGDRPRSSCRCRVPGRRHASHGPCSAVVMGPRCVAEALSVRSGSGEATAGRGGLSERVRNRAMGDSRRYASTCPTGVAPPR